MLERYALNTANSNRCLSGTNAIHSTAGQDKKGVPKESLGCSLGKRVEQDSLYLFQLILP